MISKGGGGFGLVSGESPGEGASGEGDRAEERRGGWVVNNFVIAVRQPAARLISVADGAEGAMLLMCSVLFPCRKGGRHQAVRRPGSRSPAPLLWCSPALGSQAPSSPPACGGSPRQVPVRP